MKLRIQNNAKGERGVYVGSTGLTFIAAGVTRTFDDAVASEVATVASNREFRVQTSEDGKTWEDQSRVELPEARPFLAVASGARGEGVRYIPLEPGEWFVGTALASDVPEGPQGYEWAKVGTGAWVDEDDAPTLDKEWFDSAKHSPGLEAKEVSKGDSEEPEPAPFDPTAYVSDKMPDVVAGIATMDAETLALVKAAEESTEKPRKGVLAAIEAREEELMA